MSKQDRQGVRQASDLEQKYQFGKTFAEIMGIATDAQKVALEAGESVANLDHDAVFNLLTKDGTLQGLYRKPGDDELYINAEFIKAGILQADVVKLRTASEAFGSMDEIEAFIAGIASTMDAYQKIAFAVRCDMDYSGGAWIELESSLDGDMYLNVLVTMKTTEAYMTRYGFTEDAYIQGGENVLYWEDWVTYAKNEDSVLLWSNGSPGASFAAQTVTLDERAADFNALRIMWRHSASLGYVMPSFVTRELQTRISLGHFMNGAIGTNTVNETWRYALWGDDARALVFYGGMRSGSADNTAAIPVAVYGIRM